MDTKQCSRCNLIKKSNQFYKKKYQKSGLSSECKECSLKYIHSRKNRAPSYVGKKQCNVCGHFKSKKDFYKNSQSKDGLYGQCSACFELKRLEQRYSITIEELKNLNHKQNGLCALCEKNKKLCVDHCHKTGKIRGLLCTDCNTALGKLGDTKESISKVLDYVS